MVEITLLDPDGEGELDSSVTGDAYLAWMIEETDPRVAQVLRTWAAEPQESTFAGLCHRAC